MPRRRTPRPRSAGPRPVPPARRGGPRRPSRSGRDLEDRPVEAARGAGSGRQRSPVAQAGVRVRRRRRSAASCSATRAGRGAAVGRPGQRARRGRRAPTRTSGVSRGVDRGQRVVVDLPELAGRARRSAAPAGRRSRARRGTATPLRTSHSATSVASACPVAAAADIRSSSDPQGRRPCPASAGSTSSSVLDRVEDRLLVLLQVAVVGERQALERREQRHQVADQPAGLAAGQLGDVGVLLLRHDRRPGGVARRRARPSRTPWSPRGRSPRRAATGAPRAAPRRSRNSATKSRSDTASIELSIGAGEAELGGDRRRVERQRRAGQRAGARAG